MTNCFGRERIAANENVMMPMPHVEKIAVVTASGPIYFRQSTCFCDHQKARGQTRV